jgi:glycosyltransferase involved in cell wall biosynthesis
MKIAIVDYQVVRTNPSGSCNLSIITGLSGEHQFVVFSNEFENPAPDRVQWIKVPAIRRPLVALFLSFHLTAALRYLRHCKIRKEDPGLVQSVESNFGFGTLVYAHFCHRWFLKHKWRDCKPRQPVRRFLRWADHKFHAWLEPLALKRSRKVVVPSWGLARELCAEYPFVAPKIQVIPNPVDTGRFSKPADFDAAALRAKLGISASDRMLVFVALGQFERKGLPLILDALNASRETRCKLVVVGGTPSLIRSYQQRAAERRLQAVVQFVGVQTDIRPYLWAADLFLLPSHYEVFPLALLQASAAGCPVLTTRLNGVEEFLDERSAFLVEATSGSIQSALAKFHQTPQDALAGMAARAQAAAAAYDLNAFTRAWRLLYRELSTP